MGPACAQDQLTNDLITALSHRPGVPNHWSECWIDLQLGIAYTCGGKDIQAKGSLERAVLAAGQFDHPLTGMAFLELGRLALLAADYTAATNYFAEASYAAGIYMDPIVVEEALRCGQMTHLLPNRPGVFPPLAAATLWAKAKQLRHLNVLTEMLAGRELLRPGAAANRQHLLATAAGSTGRRTMMMGKIGARWNFVSALAAYQQAKYRPGIKVCRPGPGLSEYRLIATVPYRACGHAVHERHRYAARGHGFVQRRAARSDADRLGV